MFLQVDANVVLTDIPTTGSELVFQEFSAFFVEQHDEASKKVTVSYAIQRIMEQVVEFTTC